jgi:hypothetical protein
MVGFDEWRRGVAPRPLTTGSAFYETARLSPDGHSLAVVRTESDGLSLQILSLQGGPPREVARFVTTGGLSWSPSGDQLVVTVVDPDSGKGLRIFPAMGGASRTVFYGAVGDTPDWMDDSTVVVPRLGNHTLQVVKPFAGKHYLVPGLDTTGWMLWPRTSPDGRRVAFAWNAGHGRQGVYSLTLADSSLDTLMAGLMNPAGWARDGRTVFLIGGGFLADTDRVLAVHADGTGRTVLGSFPFGMEVLDVSSDGKTAVINLHGQRSDAWVIQFPPGVP